MTPEVQPDRPPPLPPLILLPSAASGCVRVGFSQLRKSARVAAVRPPHSANEVRSEPRRPGNTLCTMLRSPKRDRARATRPRPATGPDTRTRYTGDVSPSSRSATTQH